MSGKLYLLMGGAAQQMYDFYQCMNINLQKRLNQQSRFLWHLRICHFPHLVVCQLRLCSLYFAFLMSYSRRLSGTCFSTKLEVPSYCVKFMGDISFHICSHSWSTLSKEVFHHIFLQLSLCDNNLGNQTNLLQQDQQICAAPANPGRLLCCDMTLWVSSRPLVADITLRIFSWLECTWRFPLLGA